MADDKVANFISSTPEAFMADPKPTDDHTEEVDQFLQKAEEHFKNGDFEVVIEDLLALEKRCRQSCDGVSTSRTVCFLLEKLKLLGKYKEINEYLKFFNKKRGQLKKTLIDMVHLCKDWLKEENMDKKIKTNLINTLCAITQGKIFVEVERSEVVKILSKMKEDEGDIEAAANILQDDPVDTYISMDKREKTEYILEQLRLVLLKKDFIRCQVISRKIDPKLLNTDDQVDLKLKYFRYMIELHIHEESYSDVSKCYEQILNTNCIKNDLNEFLENLKCYVIYLALSPHDEQQNKFLNLVKIEKNKLKEIPVFESIVNDFLSRDLIQWPLHYERDLLGFHVFTDIQFIGGQKRWDFLKKKVMFHNIYVISNCYDRITLNRLSQLLNVGVEDAENLVSELVGNKLIVAKIDRLYGIVKFGQKNNPEKLLNEWSAQINQILDLLEESSHLIQKEKMLHEAKLKRMQLESKNVSS